MSKPSEEFTEPSHPGDEPSHPGDVSAAEHNTGRRRFALGMLIALSLNLAFLTGGAAVANYVAAIFRPFFFKGDKMVYVTLDVTPSPVASPSPQPPPSFR